MHIRISRRIVGQDDSFCQRGHVSERESMPEIVAKGRVSRREAMFRKKRFESVWVVRMGNVFKNRRMLGSREGGGKTRND